MPGVTVSSWSALAVAALVLGVVNAIVRPILVILTLPITVLTLGLFYLVVNGLAFALAAALVPGFQIAGWGAAILGALVTSVVSWFIGIFVKRDWTTARCLRLPSGSLASGSLDGSRASEDWRLALVGRRRREVKRTQRDLTSGTGNEG